MASMGQYLFPRQSDRCLAKRLVKAISYFAHHGGYRKASTPGSVTNEGVAAGLFTASRVLILVVSVILERLFFKLAMSSMGLADLGT